MWVIPNHFLILLYSVHFSLNQHTTVWTRFTVNEKVNCKCCALKVKKKSQLKEVTDKSPEKCNKALCIHLWY